MGFMSRKRTLSTARIEGEKDLYYRYQNLSEMWKEYAELISHTDNIMKDKLYFEAMQKASDYKRGAIDTEEELLLKAKASSKNTDESDNL